MKKTSLLLVGILLIAGLATGASADPILPGSSSDGGHTWTASDAEGRSAEAFFYRRGLQGGALWLQLTNTALETSQPNEVLAGIFFDCTLILTNPYHVYVDVDTGSGIFNNDGTSFPVVYTVTAYPILDGEYGWLTGIDAINGELGDYGLSSTGFDPGANAPAGWTGFGADSIIDNTKSYGNPSPNGAEFGLVGTDVSNLVTSVDPYVQNSILVSWVVPDNSVIEIGQVNFLYGTEYSKVPEPGTMLLLGLGLIGIAGLRRKL